MDEHKSRVSNEKCNMLLYQKLRETNIEDWYIELYEEFSCENKEQLNKREGEIIRESGTLNKNITGRPKKEYQEEYQEKIKNNQKKRKIITNIIKKKLKNIQKVTKKEKKNIIKNIKKIIKKK
jgi:hypothetical protein